MKERCATIYEKNMKAFDIIEHLIACYNNDEDKCSTMEACNSCEHSATLEEITEALEVAISALEKQEADRWILVTEKMPEEYKWIGTKHFETTISDEVYVTIEVPSGERITKHMCFQNGSIPAFKQRSIDAFYKGGKVVAWKPLPEPYQEDKA